MADMLKTEDTWALCRLVSSLLVAANDDGCRTMFDMTRPIPRIWTEKGVGRIGGVDYELPALEAERSIARSTSMPHRTATSPVDKTVILESESLSNRTPMDRMPQFVPTGAHRDRALQMFP